MISIVGQKYRTAFGVCGSPTFLPIGSASSPRMTPEEKARQKELALIEEARREEERKASVEQHRLACEKWEEKRKKDIQDLMLWSKALQANPADVTSLLDQVFKEFKFDKACLFVKRWMDSLTDPLQVMQAYKTQLKTHPLVHTTDYSHPCLPYLRRIAKVRALSLLLTQSAYLDNKAVKSWLNPPILFVRDREVRAMARIFRLIRNGKTAEAKTSLSWQAFSYADLMSSLQRALENTVSPEEKEGEPKPGFYSGTSSLPLFANLPPPVAKAHVDSLPLAKVIL